MEVIFPFNFSLLNTTNQTKSKIESLLSANLKYYPHIPFITPFSSTNFSKHSHIWKGVRAIWSVFPWAYPAKTMMRRGSAWINNFHSYSLNNQPSYQYQKDPVLHKWSVHLRRSNRVVPPLAHQLAATLFIRTTSKILLPPATKSVFCKKCSLKATYL